ncbi:MAG: NAD-dependent epimerase/dehydratase family protein [Acidobacteriia bacterium]|jgi:nucleoside-diphosphate-sugar epimerase|nr:NAD-dependent epimerase/dehydratase family protein [Terriglobia bacterium]
MRTLVTGAQGCIGSWVVKRLIEAGNEVVTFDVNDSLARLEMISDAGVVAKVNRRVGKIEDTAAVKALVKDEGITHICHLAAVLMPFCAKNPVEGALINVVGTLNVFEAAKEAGLTEGIVYASSSAVWGPTDEYGEGELTEDLPTKPKTHYGVYKAANEGNARIFFANDGISSIGLRPWTVFGPGRDAGLTADPTLAMRAVAQRQPFQIRLSGHMDLQYTQDVADIFIRCMVSGVQGAHAFNLRGEVIAMEDLVTMLDELRPEAKGLITVAGNPVPVAYRMSDAALVAAIGEVPRTPLREAVLSTINKFESLG